MGWVSNLLKRNSSPESNLIHVNDLPEWLEKEKLSDSKIQNLNNSLSTFVTTLNDTRWILECNLDSWEKKIDINDKHKEEIKEIFSDSRQLLDLFTFTEEPELNKITKVNSLFELKSEQLIKKIEKSAFADNFLFMLNENEKNVDVNPLLRELINFNGMIIEFKKQTDQSGWNSFQNISEKINVLDQNRDKVKLLREELKVKEERFKLTEEKKKDKIQQLNELKEESDFLGLEKSEETDHSPEIKEFQNKIEDMQYRVNHFTEQSNNLKAELDYLNREIESTSNVISKNIYYLKNLIRSTLDKEIEIKI